MKRNTELHNEFMRTFYCAIAKLPIGHPARRLIIPRPARLDCICGETIDIPKRGVEVFCQHPPTIWIKCPACNREETLIV